jgi:uncharacterized protein YmfQ (DUF2313 family)
MDGSAYLSQLLALLPPGDALAREPGSRLERLLSVPAAELARVDGRVEALLVESDAARTTEMLADWERALGLPDECYPNESFSRASRAWYFDGAGVLREAAVDEPRYLYDAAGQRTEAVLVEAAATNSVPNARAGGAVVGTPGVLPTGFTVSGAPLALAEITFVGAEDGLPCVELRIAGTLGAAGDLDIAFTTSTATPAVMNDVFTGSFFWRLISGTNPTNWRMRFEEYSSGGALLVGNQVDLSPATNAALRGQRASSAYTVANASAAFLRHVMRLRFAAGAVNATLRIAVPQLERGPVATSPILNPVGAPAATTRAADQRYVATVAERRARVLARLIERFEPTPTAIIGLAARLGDAVTLTEFSPHDCEDACEAPLLDTAWAHAFQVSGASSLVVEFTCEDGVETPLNQWRTGAYECAIRRFAPAHTVPIFSYGAPPPPPPVPSIITSGLVMHLDAGDAASYPGSGTAWTDLSGAGNSGTLTNGPTYSAANGGQIIFDGSNDFVGAGNAAGLQLSVFTLEIWFKANNTNSNYRGLLVKELAWGLYLFNNTLGSYDTPSVTFQSTGINAGDNTWRQAVMTIAAGGGSTIYVNGSLVLTASGSVGSQANPVTVGSGNGLQFMSGSVAIARIYNRALSAPEIIQNFDVNRGRFGL